MFSQHPASCTKIPSKIEAQKEQRELASLFKTIIFEEANENCLYDHIPAIFKDKELSAIYQELINVKLLTRNVLNEYEYIERNNELFIS